MLLQLHRRPVPQEEGCPVNRVKLPAADFEFNGSFTDIAQASKILGLCGTVLGQLINCTRKTCNANSCIPNLDLAHGSE